MNLNPILILVVIFYYSNSVVSIEINEESLYFIADYDFSWVKEKESELRRRFLDKKQENKEQNYRIELFEKLNNATLYEDEILHNFIGKRFSRYKNYMKYEKLFKNLLSMNGVKYVYKRDFFWRTWRVINDSNNTSSVVFYKCNSFNSSSAYWGHWSIEEHPPPCPYEIFSLIDIRKICVIKYTELSKPVTSCDFKVSLEELLATCNNPIETRWRIVKNYRANVGTSDICQGRDLCDITTLYTINADSITFRIVNDSNHVFYSRVMKPGRKNYACDLDCGKIDLKTQRITKNSNHILVNLLKTNQKNKRENVVGQNRNRSLEKPIIKHGLHYPVQQWTTDKKPLKLTTKSPCKLFEDSYYLKREENDSDYDYPARLSVH